MLVKGSPADFWSLFYKEINGDKGIDTITVKPLIWGTSNPDT